MFDADDTEPQYLQIAAKMLDMTVGEMYESYPGLAEKLTRINDKILKVKPYGIFHSTQTIATIIDDYLYDNEIDSRLTYIEEMGKVNFVNKGFK